MRKRILILSNHFITLYNFRKELIKLLLEKGHDVFISMPESEHNQWFHALGCKIINTPVDRRGMNPLRDFGLTLRYIKIMQEVQPDIIFSYTVKPNIYGCIASNFKGYKQVSNITGTGNTFIKNNIISMVAKVLYKVAVKKSHKVFFQNYGDRNYFVKNKMILDNYAMLPGSGVNLDEYALYELPPDDKVNFIFVGRIMSVKGIDQYLEAAQIIKESHPNTNFYIAGFIEEEKYQSIINEYQAKGAVIFIGFQEDIIPWIQRCHCTILPSHGGEGVPNAILESAATGRACIASRISGSEDAIDDGKTGYLFEPGKTADLVRQVNRFIELDYNIKKSMGLAGRQKVEKEFDRRIIIEAYLNEIK